MAWVTLYSYQADINTVRTISRDTADPTHLDFFDYTGSGAPPALPNGTRVGNICNGFDEYTYFSSTTGSPYATYTVLRNSTTCGYVPPACDIRVVTFAITPETNIHNNNGTANLFAASSFPIVNYQLNDGFSAITNTTGYFTGIVPGTYSILALDSNGCTVFRDFTIDAFGTGGTQFKYRLKFIDVNGLNNWELRFYDQRNVYDPYVYPLDITGSSGSPLVKTTANQDEDKTESILPTILDILLYYTGFDFVPNEFTSTPEQSWKVELWLNGALDFQGWLLPDQTQDYYRDIPYEIKVQASDGLPSLKGNVFGDGSGGQGYSNFQIQQYGLATWASLVKQCLDQLGYDYGNVILISSLQYNGVYDSNLWINISTWSDILYDGSGTALDTYSALQLLLAAFKLSIFQYQGRFVLANWNDLSYIDNTFKVDLFHKAFYQFTPDMTGIQATGIEVAMPLLQVVGYQNPIQPINPPQSLTYDKPYNIEVDIQFNILALLYENPSFEIGAVQGDVPPGWHVMGSPNIYVNYDPVVPGVIGSGAYDGVWELKSNPSGDIGPVNTFIENPSPFFPIDQINKQLNVSFQWKVPQCFITPSVGIHKPSGYVYSFTCVYIDSISGHGYFLSSGNKTVSYSDYLVHSVLPPNIASGTTWQPLTGGIPVFSEGDAFSIKGSPVTDYIGWQGFNITAPIFPESQIGTVSIRFYGAKRQFYDTSVYVTDPPHPTYNDSFYLDADTHETGYYLVDSLNITLTDASPTSTLQTGEDHFETVATGLPNANLKNVTLGLFTYVNNKRVAGNVFYGSTYLTGQVQNLWNFALSTNDPQDRLPATVSKAIARNYARPMIIFEGDIEFNTIQFYAMFILRFYESIVFQPFDLKIDCRNANGHIIMIECSDDLAQFTYNYVAIYANGARQNSN